MSTLVDPYDLKPSDLAVSPPHPHAGTEADLIAIGRRRDEHGGGDASLQLGPTCARLGRRDLVGKSLETAPSDVVGHAVGQGRAMSNDHRRVRASSLVKALLTREAYVVHLGRLQRHLWGTMHAPHVARISLR